MLLIILVLNLNHQMIQNIQEDPGLVSRSLIPTIQEAERREECLGTE